MSFILRKVFTGKIRTKIITPVTINFLCPIIFGSILDKITLNNLNFTPHRNKLITYKYKCSHNTNVI